MPTLDELQKITRVTAPLEPKTAAAMRLIFLLTEQQSGDMNRYIAAALRPDALIPPSVAKVLQSYNLVDSDGKIPDQLKAAIQNAVETNHLTLKPESHKIQCQICAGPHTTKRHNAWVEKPEEMAPEEIASELEKYTDVLNALKSGGLSAAEKSLNDIGLTMNAAACFCGTPNHTGVDHLRWLADKETEI
tara:strand:+ start:3958 stop:4527 length:570 start_codon:yes stop_codon:yes gene_type:complete